MEDTGLESRKVRKDFVFLHNNCIESRIHKTHDSQIVAAFELHEVIFTQLRNSFHLTSRFQSLDSVETTVSSQILKTFFILP